MTLPSHNPLNPDETIAEIVSCDACLPFHILIYYMKKIPNVFQRLVKRL